MPEWIDGGVLPPILEPLPDDGEVFLLPVCINRATLNRLLSAASMGAKYLPQEPHDPDSLFSVNDYTHIFPLLEAMAYVGTGTSPCVIETPGGGACLEIGAFHPAIGYYPNHPVLTPDYIAPGYSAPAWKNNVTEAGYAPTDAIMEPLSLDLFADIGELIGAGVPSWTLTFEGIGEIDVRFMSQIQGGAVWVFPDGNPLLGDMVDLNWRDLTDFASIGALYEFIEILQQDPGIFEVEYTKEFTTEGPHTLTAWYLPVGELEPPFLGLGGGLRSIQICGEITLESESVLPYTLVQAGCTVTLQLDGVPVSTIEVMTPVPDCAFENTVTIQREATGQFSALALRNLRDASSENDGSQILWYANNLAHQQQLQAYIRSTSEPGLAEGRMFLGVGNAAGAFNDIIRLNTGVVGLQVLASATLGHTTALRVERTDGVFNSNFAIASRSGSQNLLTAGWNGEVNVYRQNLGAAAIVTGLALDAWASGVTPAAGYGTRLKMRGNSSATPARDMADIESVWGLATDAQRAALVRHRVYNYAGSVVPLQYSNYDGASAIAVHGNTPMTRPTITGTDIVAVVNSLLSALTNYGWILNTTAIAALEAPNITNVRVVDCVLEAQYSGSAAWVAVGTLQDCGPAGPAGPAGDGIYAPIVTPNLTDLDGQFCSIADQIVTWLDSSFNDFLDTVDAVTSVVDFIGSIIALGGPAGLVADALTEFYLASATLGTATIRAAITTEVVEDAKCKLYCQLVAAESYSFGVLGAWRDQVYAESGTNVALQEVWLGTLDAYTESIWNQRAYIGSLDTSNACALCECDEDPPPPQTGFCFEVDFTTITSLSEVGARFYNDASGNWGQLVIGVGVKPRQVGQWNTAIMWDAPGEGANEFILTHWVSAIPAGTDARPLVSAVIAENTGLVGGVTPGTSTFTWAAAQMDDETPVFGHMLNTTVDDGGYVVTKLRFQFANEIEVHGGLTPCPE